MTVLVWNDPACCEACHAVAGWVGRRALTWFLVADVDVEPQDDDVGEERSPPVDDKHDHAAEDGSSQRDPHVVVLEAGTPTWSGEEQTAGRTSGGSSQDSNQTASLFSPWF